MKLFFRIALCLFLVKCANSKVSNNITASNPKDNLYGWFHKDIHNNEIPGISLDKWCDKNVGKNNTQQNITVAILDSQLDINHEDLKSQIWINKGEIPDNGIDDDQNGYVDDVNGWSFLGGKNGQNLIWSNFDYIRLIRKSKEKFELDTLNSPKDFKEYKRAIAFFKKEKNYYQNYLKSLEYGIVLFPLAKDTLKHYFPKEDYTYSKLDSLYKIYGNGKSFWEKRDAGDKDFAALIHSMMVNKELNINSIDYLIDKADQQNFILKKCLDFDYNERVDIMNFDLKNSINY
ncbi:S8 family serine peptidase [Flavobacterium sp. SM15]|uniref:S8 family serine peptidase n=1 Tax=Flavobacterium sp. SM15 TaxID=2908005 RepID=UPI001EDC7011|nr:S8 family serine peptidase [Flavobacterium sp. SM15]MCG2612223.1 S8 family serine peptidase [Flavobacterium sp. SM15]